MPVRRARFPAPSRGCAKRGFLSGSGAGEQARSIAEEVVRSLGRAPRHVQANEREWFARPSNLPADAVVLAPLAPCEKTAVAFPPTDWIRS